jgi:hypothetical protein
MAQARNAREMNRFRIAIERRVVWIPVFTRDPFMPFQSIGIDLGKLSFIWLRWLRESMVYRLRLLLLP